MAKLSPVKFKDISEDEMEIRKKLFPVPESFMRDMVVSEDGNITLTKGWKNVADKIYNFEVRPDDVWIVTYPKCGTTLTQVKVKFLLAFDCLIEKLFGEGICR